ncbi:hypothetical protein BCR36DRAFT_360348 [Piromyces finnis]|uniref:Uncharacterized protein n=1 Tax=Piromyces finnis TaxID=1754191 RepID=A0A1Y1UZ86_9FUNG|nr:hypothetical protein BCR36DRAFT_360348 [Piromyces finnis]|eukprot:ORX43932.1 hypothetical protein BCR36DRAFT_360348 [Piromyces finnis]
MKSIYYYYFICILILIVNAMDIGYSSINPMNRLGRRRIPNPDNTLTDDGSYLVIINTKDKSQAIETIHKLILENKGTFKDQNRFEEIQLDHDKNRNNYLVDYGDSGYVYEISSLKGKSVLYVWLSTELVDRVRKLPFVLAVSINRKMKIY